MTAGEEPPRLVEIKIEVTQRCRLSCIHCSSEGTEAHPVEMSRDKTIAIVREAAEMGVREVTFSGGEPFLWPDLGDAIAASAGTGMEVSLYTSGNVKDFGTAVRKLAESGLRNVAFSIFAAEEGVHDSITQVPGSFGKTLASLAEAVRAGLATEIHFVPMRVNLDQFPAVADLGLANGVRRVSVLRFVPHGRGGTHSGLALTHKDNIRLQRMVRKARERIEVRTGSPYNFLLLNQKPRCLAATDRLVVTPDLRIYPCDGFKRIPAEQVVQTDRCSRLDEWSLAECWSESPYLGAVRCYLATPFGAPCADCKDLSRCGSGCLAQKVLAYGTLAQAPDPMCIHGEFTS